MTPPADHCPDDQLNDVIQLAATDDDGALRSVETLLEDYPGDARLHFLRGSFLAAQKRYDEARAGLQQAVDLAPGFSVARFQLGLLELSSGAATEADETLAPLTALPPTDPFQRLSQGLRHLMRDEFPEAIANLEAGIALNEDNPAINADMRMIIRNIENTPPPEDSAEPISSAHWLLQQQTRTTRH